jgi:hypothetical protein
MLASRPSSVRPPSPHRRRLLVALALTSAVAGCGLENGEPLEESQQGLTLPPGATNALLGISRVDFPKASRWVRVNREWRCDICGPSYSSDGYPIYDPPVCTCDWWYKEVMVSASNADAINEVPFGSYINPTPRVYQGCGVQAVQNILAYYGDQKSIYDVAKFVGTIWLGPGNLGSTPDQVMSGLNLLLNGFNQKATTSRQSYVTNLHTRIIGELQAGRPVAAIVRAGNHWQVITGVRSDPVWRSLYQYYVVDYENKATGTGPYGVWKNESELRFDDWDIAPTLVSGAGGYYPQTLVTTTVTAAPPPPPSPPAYCPTPWYSCGEYQTWNPNTCSCASWW